MVMARTSTSTRKIPIPDDNPKRIVDLTRRSVEFIKEHAGKRPFFLMVSHYAVHIPHQASPAAIERCRRRWVAAGNPDVGPDEKEYKKNFPEWQYENLSGQSVTEHILPCNRSGGCSIALAFRAADRLGFSEPPRRQ